MTRRTTAAAATFSGFFFRISAFCAWSFNCISFHCVRRRCVSQSNSFVHLHCSRNFGYCSVDSYRCNYWSFNHRSGCNCCGFNDHCNSFNTFFFMTNRLAHLTTLTTFNNPGAVLFVLFYGFNRSWTFCRRFLLFRTFSTFWSFSALWSLSSFPTFRAFTTFLTRFILSWSSLFLIAFLISFIWALSFRWSNVVVFCNFFISILTAAILVVTTSVVITVVTAAWCFFHFYFRSR